MSSDREYAPEFISVVMPAFNAHKTIEAAIRSVLDQSWRELELLVVDDGSTDDTAAIVRSLSAGDERIRLFSNETNRGVSWCRNFGVEHARGEWIAFLDSDDLWMKEKLSKQIALASRYPECGLLFTGSGFMDRDGVRYTYAMHVPECVTYRELLKQNVISCSSVLARRELLKQFPMENDAIHEDYATWLRILRQEPLARAVDEPLLIYRISPSSKSGRKGKAAMMYLKTLTEVGVPLPAIVWNSLIYAVRSIRKYRGISASHPLRPREEDDKEEKNI